MAGGTIVVVYNGDKPLGEAEILAVPPAADSKKANPKLTKPKPPSKEERRRDESLSVSAPAVAPPVVRISHFSPPSERCPPLSVLQMIAPFSVRFKLQGAPTAPSHFHKLYLSCFKEFRTAILASPLPFLSASSFTAEAEGEEGEELHLVAMPSKVEKVPCFWCCAVPPGLYPACLAMLNLRCLTLVFDLDETLIVANTMKSFDDRIDALSYRIHAEDDSLRISGMSAELKRYIEDRELLKQYIEGNAIVDAASGKTVAAQNEEVPGAGSTAEYRFRPVIRLPERNAVLTRINPEIRDTSVFVRLRPAWEDLRSYLTAKGRKRFEVYVCTMAERDYALEMWRLLDPESHLISAKQLLDRIVCVKSGSKKSLQHVFEDKTCHPKMAMVIDDRLQVWDEKDQPRVHVVPAFTPYYAPQAEMANAVPVLCVARNVACNVRGGFFREFDDVLLRKIFELCYENDIKELPYAPDVSDYLFTEDASVAPNNRDAPILEGMGGPEVDQKLNGVVHLKEDKELHQQASNAQSSDNDMQMDQGTAAKADTLTDVGPPSANPSLFITVIEEIGRLCGSKVEFKYMLSGSKNTQFSVEVLFCSEKIGFGIGRTREEAQVIAAENGVRNLASNYMSFVAPTVGSSEKLVEQSLPRKENGFLEDSSIS